MKLKVLLLAVVSLILFSCDGKQEKAASTDDIPQKFIYVSPDGSDQNKGTKSQPLRTLKQASIKATAGSTVVVRGGTYMELLDIKHSGTAKKPIVFRSYKNEKVTLSGKHVKKPKEDTALIQIMDKNYITIQGFTVEDLTTSHADATVMGIHIAGTSSHIKLEQNHLRHVATYADDGNAHGIAVYGTGKIKDIEIRHNIVEKLRLGASEALVLNGNIDGFVIANNIVRRNNNIGIDLIGYEGTAKKHDYVRNGVVEENKVYDNSSYNNPAYGEDYSAGGIYVDGGSDISIRKNKVYRNDLGIEATSEHKGKYANKITIANNEVSDNAYTGISIGGYDRLRGGTKNTVITGNKMFKNDTKELGGGQLLLQYHATDNKINKNIFTVSDSRIFLENDSSKNKGNILSKNVYHWEKGKEGIWNWKGREFNSLAKFQKATGNDQGSEYVSYPN